MKMMLCKELKDLLKMILTPDPVLNNFSKGEDAYDPVKPQAVVFPKTNEEVSLILKLSNKYNTP